MPHEYEISRLLAQPLDDVLRKLYSATFLSWLNSEILEPLISTHADLLDGTVAFPTPSGKKKPRKDETIDRLKAVLNEPRLRSAFHEHLPAPLKAVLKILTWHGSRSLAALEETAGEPIADPNPDERRRYYEPFILRPAYGFVCLLRKDNQYGFYGAFRREATKQDIESHLPDAIRKLFKSVIPPPPEYDLQPLDAPSPAAALRYTASSIMQDLKAAAEFIEQGHVKFTKNEQLSKVCVRKFREVTNGMEFFPLRGKTDAELLRTRMLLCAVASVGPALRQDLLAATSATPLKALFAKLPADFFEEALLYHLQASASYERLYNRHVGARLARFAADMPPGKWVAGSNMISYFRFRGEVPSIYARIPHNLRITCYSQYEHLDERASDETKFTCISIPLLRGYAFLLAALGMAEIAYSDFNERDPSPFAGLDAVRLTPLGEFVLGKRQTLEIEVEAKPKCQILLDSNRLLASCTNLDPLTEMALKQFMERITHDRYRMTHKSLLGGCASRKALEERIALFRRVIAVDPPAIWEQFFTKTLNRIAPLQKEGDLVVFKLDTDDEIRRLFSTDPVLRKHCLKVEGYRIAIRQQDIRAVARHLEQLGCLCPPESLTALAQKTP
jgi:hypothetical protein